MANKPGKNKPAGLTAESVKQSTGFYFDFMGHKWVFWAISAVLIFVGFVGYFVRGGLHYGIDFQGGTKLDVVMLRTVDVAGVRGVLDTFRLGDSSIQLIAGNNEVLIRSKELSPTRQAQVIEALSRKFGVDQPKTQIQTVGPGWGANVTDSAITALAISLFVLVAYISVRFEYKMALTAIFALVHDIVLTVGIYALSGLEVTPNTVAALLTILGYSLYDTIVVFHRIRENTSHIGKQTFQQMSTESINQVLVRSINTTLVTLVPVLCLLLLGGETLRDFAFALTIGLASGAYSSIGIAAPLYAIWKETEPKYAALKRKYGAQPAQAG